MIDTPFWLFMKSPKISGNSVDCLFTVPESCKFLKFTSHSTETESHSHDFTLVSLTELYLISEMYFTPIVATEIKI